jgi:hypothetical protein
MRQVLSDIYSCLKSQLTLSMIMVSISHGSEKILGALTEEKLIEIANGSDSDFIPASSL